MWRNRREKKEGRRGVEEKVKKDGKGGKQRKSVRKRQRKKKA